MLTLLRILLIFAVLLAPFNMGIAGNDNSSPGARAAGLGGASVTHSDAFSVFSNQAGLANLNSLSVGVYGQNNFLIKDLNWYALGVGIPIKSAGAFGVGASFYGGEFYKETQFKVGYGMLLFEKLSLGAEFNFTNFSITGYGSQAAFTFGLGAQYNITSELKVGAHIFNPLRIELTDLEDDRLHTLIKAGIAYEPSNKVGIYVEMEKNLDKKPMFKGGIEYRVLEKLHLRASATGQPTAAYFGIGVPLGGLSIDIANGFHTVLGYSPHLSISYSLPKKAAQQNEIEF